MGAAIKTLRHFEAPKEPGTHYRLICLTGKDKGTAYFLTEKRVVLGRSEKADIRVHDIKSSREHAEIAKVGKDFVLTDLGSQNGVVVNDLKVKQHVLGKNDKIIIGATVYKFGAVVVKSEAPAPAAKEEESDVGESDPEERPKSKLSLVLGGVAAAALLLTLLEGGEDTAPAGAKKIGSNYKVNELSDPFIAGLKQRRTENKKNKEKLEIYFRKGLREFREENYFRAISEFEHALAWSPNDALANFYLRKTKEALDQSIEEMFIKAKRDEESLKYQNAIVSYCGILRLLYRYPEDERYVNAKESIAHLEGKLGMEEGEVKCSEGIK